MSKPEENIFLQRDVMSASVWSRKKKWLRRYYLKIYSKLLDCHSLSLMCMEELLFSNSILRRSLPLLPVTIHMALFSEAALMLPRFGKGVAENIVSLVSAWPTQRLCIRELIQDRHIQNVLHTGAKPSLLSLIVEGLLSLQSSSRLKIVDFTGVLAPSLFELPVLSLTDVELHAKEVQEAVEDKCRTFLGDEDEANLKSVLQWKISELVEKKPHTDFHATGPVEILLDCQINLTDYLSIDNELLGLTVQQYSPFKLKIVHLTLDNYHHRQTTNFRGFFDIINTQDLSKLVIYGKRRGVNLVLWDMADKLDQLTQLQSFGLGTSGPKLHVPTEDEPSFDEIFIRASKTLSRWTCLSDIFFIGVNVGQQVSTLLSSLSKPLNKLILYGCSLHRDDLVFLAGSHHIPQLQEFGLEFNNLRNLGQLVCGITSRASNLCVLNLKQTQLMLFEKKAIMETLQPLHKLHTLVLHETDDIVSTDGYKAIVELACLLTSLKEFYIFPFDYKPFELFYRELVEEICQDVLIENDRNDLELFY